MRTFTYTITEEVGLHARPALMLVKEAKECLSEVFVENKASGKRADAKKIIGILSICAKQGDTVTIIVNGEDEDQAIKKLTQYCKENL